MQLGLCLPQLGPTAEGAKVADVAWRAEEVGYDSLWAAVTSRVRLLSFSTLIPTWHKEAAGRDPGALRRETRVNTYAGETIAETAAVVREAKRRGADGVHVDFTYTAGSADELLERGEELIDLLRAG
jgi:alkanesulfonate monooxygenase SsuD/methylene tetrahydromethanopterin reductase-like flavin-dependent oxidoreductase (luciferase family)